MLAIMLLTILAGCLELPALPVSPTPAAGTPAPARRFAQQIADTSTPASLATTAVVTAGGLYVHAKPDVDSIVTGWLMAGDAVTVLECSDDFCKLEQPFGYVWRGCLSDNPNGLGCSAKK
jgi:hypothetical protein